MENLVAGTVYEICVVERSMNGTEGSPRLEKCSEFLTDDNTVMAMGIIIGVLGAIILVCLICILCMRRYYTSKVLLERAKGKIEVSRPMESNWPDWESRRTGQSNWALSDIDLPSRRTTQTTMTGDGLNGQASANVSNVSGYSQRSGKSERRGPLPPVPPSVPHRDDSFFNTTGSTRKRNAYGPKPPPPPTEPPPDDMYPVKPYYPNEDLPNYDRRAPAPLPKGKELILSAESLPGQDADKYLTMENKQPTPVPRRHRAVPDGQSPPATWKEAAASGEEYLTPSEAEEKSGAHVYHYIPYETITGEAGDHIAHTAL